MFKSNYVDNHIHHPIDNLELPFAEYIKRYRKIITDTRVDLQGDDKEKIIEANSPFELVPSHPNQKGVLLIHGLLDSPFIMRDIGKKLQSEGYLVRAIILPGHSTVPGDLLNVSYQDWIQAVAYGIASFNNVVEHVYLGGFSTGATLALYHALHQAKIAGIFLLSPAIRIRSRLDFVSNWHKIISWKWEHTKWLFIDEENDYAKYQSIPFNAVYQVYSLTKIIKKISKKLQSSCPLFFIVSMADTTVSALASVNYFKQYFNIQNQLLLYSRFKTHINDANTKIRTSIYPEFNIIDFSHIALPTSPDNPHYGKQGSYIQASRVTNDKTIVYGNYNVAENMLYQFLHKKNLIKVQKKRLSYNPDFDFMMNEIIRFFDH